MERGFTAVYVCHYRAPQVTCQKLKLIQEVNAKNKGDTKSYGN